MARRRETKPKSIYVLKKGEKLTVKTLISKTYPFINEKSVRYLHKNLKEGMPRGIIHNHLMENYEEEVKIHIGSPNRMKKKTDNMLRVLQGARRGQGVRGGRKPLIYHSDKKYPDSSKGGKGRVTWWATKKRIAKKAGEKYEKIIQEQLKNQVGMKLGRKSQKTLEERQIVRYKKRLLNETESFTRLRGEEHERILKKALDEVVQDLMGKGLKEKVIIDTLSGNRKVIKDMLDIKALETRAMRNIGEISLKKAGKEVNAKRKKDEIGREIIDRREFAKLEEKRRWILNRHLDYEMGKTWEEEIKKAINRRKGSKFFMGL